MNEQFPNHQHQDMGFPPTQPEENVMPLLSMIFGISAIVVGCCCTYLGIGLGIAAIVLAVVCKNKNIDYNRGFRITGFVTGIIGTITSTINMIAGIVLGVTGFWDGFFSAF